MIFDLLENQTPTTIQHDEVDFYETEFSIFDNYSEGSEKIVKMDVGTKICALCEMTLLPNEKRVILLGKTWHLHHSQCYFCEKVVGSTTLTQVGEFLYCDIHLRGILK